MLLKINHLSKEYKRGANNFYAVNDVNLHVKEGEYISIIGHSGSGKSTLLNMMAGLLKPTGGEIIFEGVCIAQSNNGKHALLRNHKLGYVMQGQNLLSNFNVIDNIGMPYYLSKTNIDIRKQSLELLEQVGLVDAKNAFPAQLSGGELRRVAIARALIHKPILIIADEPTSNLDPENSVKIMKILKTINQNGTAVIVSTHDMEFLNYSQKSYRMTEGKLAP
jgi:putative ABC transport system ATP-binding protein